MSTEPSTDTIFIRATHHYAFRSKEWARIVTSLEHDGRTCWLVTFPDGVSDWWAHDDPDAGYEFSDGGFRRE